MLSQQHVLSSVFSVLPDDKSALKGSAYIPFLMAGLDGPSQCYILTVSSTGVY